MVEATIQSSVKVMQFFRIHHDEKSAIKNEMNKIESFRAKVQGKRVCLDYNSKSNFEASVATVISKQDN